MEPDSMPPEEDARAILRLAMRHEQSLGASLDPAFAQENWGFQAQQCVENLLKGLIVLSDEQPPLSHDLERLQLLAGVVLPEELLALQEFAVKARYSPKETPFRALEWNCWPGSANSGGSWRVCWRERTGQPSAPAGPVGVSTSPRLICPLGTPVAGGS